MVYFTSLNSPSPPPPCPDSWLVPPCPCASTTGGVRRLGEAHPSRPWGDTPFQGSASPTAGPRQVLPKTLQTQGTPWTAEVGCKVLWGGMGNSLGEGLRAEWKHVGTSLAPFLSICPNQAPGRSADHKMGSTTRLLPSRVHPHIPDGGPEVALLWC